MGWKGHRGLAITLVKSGTLFDNILICDDPEYAKKFAEETWGKQKDGEKAAFDEVEKKKEAEEESEKSDIDQFDMLMLKKRKITMYFGYEDFKKMSKRNKENREK
ncbi:hypothetical protein AAC387_Pa01g2643 [Persea americana]